MYILSRVNLFMLFVDKERERERERERESERERETWLHAEEFK